MKLKIYFILIIMSIVTIIISIYYTKTGIQLIKQEKAKQLYQIRTKEYRLLLKDKKDFLNSLAKFLSSSNVVINSYITNNKQELINFAMPLYKNLYKKNLIEELHFFKNPVINFVNFQNLNTCNINMINERKDILRTDIIQAPSTHFYICNTYPGLRTIYPIKYNGKLLGSVSFGININIFKKLFKKLDVNDISIYLNNSYLKKYLLPKNYSIYTQYPTYQNYKVLGNTFNITLAPGYEIKGYNIYTKIKIKDFFNHTIAYIVIKDNISKDLKILESKAKDKIIITILSYFFIFAIIFMLFKWIFDKLNEMNLILYHIKNKNFSQIPKKTVPKDDFDKYKNTLIDVANDIKTYINILNQKVEKYSDKAYKDALTNIFNRRFLEEKSEELFLKYKLSDMQVGVIMLDIDNFKKINDTYGHDIGDLVLITLVSNIQKIIRKNDIFIRYGGEEFIIILPNSNIQNTYKIAKKMQQQIEKNKINLGEAYLNFTISLGVSEVDKNDENLYDAIKRADINLYKAKKNGKNRVEL